MRCVSKLVESLTEFLTESGGATDGKLAALFVQQVDKGKVVWDRALWDFTIKEYISSLRTDPPQGGITNEYLLGRALETNAVKCRCYRKCTCV